MCANECSRHGVCSISPGVAAFQKIMQIIISTSAYYILKLSDSNSDFTDIKRSIISTLANMISVYDYSNSQLLDTIICHYNYLIRLKREYISYCKSRKIKPVHKKNVLKITPDTYLSDLLLQGQKLISEDTQLYNLNKKCYTELTNILIKNASHSLIKLSDYTIIEEKNINLLLSIITSAASKRNLKKLTELNKELWLMRYEAQKRKFGEIRLCMVNRSTTKGKAILVTGSNLFDLYNLLSEITDVDVYTHGNLLIAHAYYGFQKFKNLKGHFSGVNDSSDFSNFPGAIYLTKYSAYNLENIYRGKIFSFDDIKSKNVIKLDSFDELIAYSDKMTGFKNSHSEKPFEVGYSHENLLENLSKIDVNSKVAVVYNHDNSPLLPPKADFTLSFSKIKESGYSVNLSENMPVQFYIINELIKYTNPENISFYFTSCDFNSMTLILILNNIGIKNIYLTERSPVLINPSVRREFMKIFDIKELKKSP